MYLKIAIAFVLIALLIAAITVTALSRGQDDSPATVIASGVDPIDGCNQIEGGRICWTGKYWQPQCRWPYKAVFAFKKCVIKGVRG